MGEISIQKLRRFSLIFGLILFTYSIAGVELETPARISPLGIPFILRRADLLGYGLLLGSLYGLLRYWYYAILIGLSPRRARKAILSGTFTDGSAPRFESSSGAEVERARKEIERYFPLLPLQKNRIEFTLSSEEGIVLNDVPLSSKILSLIHDIDYYSPIWVNLVAISVFFLF